MHSRLAVMLQLACLVLGAVFVYQLARLGAQPDPLAQLRVGTVRVPPAKPADPAAARSNLTSRTRVKPDTNLPPDIRARIDKITQSEILGPVIRPLPMALLGIAGRDVILRAPNGQTGLLRAGEELGGVRLLRIGTNRVLIEHEAQQKELTLFSGFGSETLLGKETPK